MLRTMRRMTGLVLVVVLWTLAATADELRINRYFSDGMVLQRDKPVVIRGLAKPGEMVTVQFGGQEKAGKAGDDGMWSVTLDPMNANTKAQSLSAKAASGKVTLKDVLVGDVFLFARQTAVDVSLGSKDAGKTVAAKSTFRAISINTIPAAKPLSDLAAEATEGWMDVSRDSALKMSAAAYYLGRDLAADVDVPVGIIDLNLGSAFPNSWLSRTALEETSKFYDDGEVASQVQMYDEKLAAEIEGVPFKKAKVAPSNTVFETLFPSGGYNAVLNPLKDLALKAALVQLGNDYPYMIYADILASDDPSNRAQLNTAYVETYNIRKVGFRMESKTAPRIAREWRKTLGETELPMGLIVPPGSDLNTLGQHHREMRELQRLVAADNANVGIILPGSENTPFSAQPADEALLAQRALSWVQGAVYERADRPATGADFAKLDLNSNEATIHFKAGTAKGLKATGNALDYFEVAGVEGDYSPAKASIVGDTIQLESDTINRIMRVRYNWNKRPNQELVNAAGLPAIPFRSEKLPYHWFVTNADDDLPVEYSTPANAWPQNDVTLINGQLQTHGYPNFTGWLGPIGVKTGPFGPNMGVREVTKGSPADGLLFEDDILYSANGNMLGDKAWEVLGAAITESETKQAKGKLVLGLRRGSKNMDVEITLEVMGTYSATAPYDCLKTEKIIDQLEAWLLSKGAGAGFLNYDAVFMLATGKPELQGYVRRNVYNIIGRKDPNRPIDTKREGKSWHNSAEAILLGEYYMATGDRNVLPHLKHACARLAATQHPEFGGWRQNFPGGAHYGLIPNAGLPGVMGMYFADKAGIDIDKAAFQKSIAHYSTGKAETGFLIYGLGACQRDVPKPFDPDVMANGNMDSFNGGLSAAAILMRFVENHRAAHLSSMISAYSFNNTFGGHGGNFWNNFWTPLGAHQHSKKAYVHFWKGHRWYRECSRMFDGSLIGGGDRVSAGYGVALVAPRKRIQIVGAPPSPFAADAPEGLKPAVELYAKKDYAGCENLVSELVASGAVGKDDMPTVDYLARAARDIQESITADLTRMKTLAEAGNPNEARSFILGLKSIMADGDARLAEIEKVIASAKTAPVVTVAAKEPEREAKNAADLAKMAAKKAEVIEVPREWVRLVTETTTGNSRQQGKMAPVVSGPEKSSVWKINVVEDLAQAPEGWTSPKFNDADWKETTLPISWRMYHTALLRTTFNVKDKAAYDGLRLYAWVFRQQGIEIYLNGEMVGKVNNIEKKTGDITNEFKESAMKHLKNGENTLAVTTRHNWRWGMLFMRVYNDGFDFNLDARVKDGDS
jgi:sialate O-acetylesterase